MTDEKLMEIKVLQEKICDFRVAIIRMEAADKFKLIAFSDQYSDYSFHRGDTVGKFVAEKITRFCKDTLTEALNKKLAELKKEYEEA